MGEIHGEAKRRRFDYRLHLTREPVIIAALASAALVCFGFVTGLSGIYHNQQRAFGTEYFDRGSVDLKARNFKAAAEEFRTALLYSRDNYNYLLDLAEALLGQGKTEAARAYLTNLWDREPANGIVNLELARISAREGQPREALRYYHDAIYATWPENNRTARRDARLELIRYLLTTNNHAQAQAELIALAANLEDDPARETQVGDLFMQTRDYTDALTAYRQALKTSKNDPAALAGAGRASFELGRYRDAERYLREELAANSGNKDSADLLETADLVLKMNPFQHDLPAYARYSIIEKGFEEAGKRLESCGVPTAAVKAPLKETATTQPPSAPPPPPLSALGEQWIKMKPQVNAAGLRRDPDLIENAMDLVFDIERQSQTAAGCPPQTTTDRALLLIARLHEGS